MKTSTLFKGTLILTISGIISRLLGFFYRIFLTHFIGAEGLGLYQMVFPIIGLSMAISCSGLSMAISRFTAYHLSRGNSFKARQSMVIGMILSFIISLPCSLILFFFSNEIALYFLKDIRCTQLIQLVSLMLPLSVIHNSITSYYIGKSNAFIPAVSQLLEQCIRIGSVLLIFTIQQNNGLPITALTGMAGLFCGELASSLFCLTICSFKLSDMWRGPYTAMAREMIHMSLPISANRVLLSAFHSAEAMLIPLMLRKGGLSTSDSLSIYGILSGMAVPLVMLPSTLVNSFSTMLLPAVSQSTTSTSSKTSPDVHNPSPKHTNPALMHNIQTGYQCSLLVGILCFGAFWAFGKDAGKLLFGEPLAGVYTRAFSWMCPFLYLGTTLSSILNGLGKTRQTLGINISSLIIRIGLIVTLIPRIGITGFFAAFLISEMYLALSSAYTLHRIYPIELSATDWILKPILALGIAIGVSLYASHYLLNFFPILSDLIRLLLGGGSLVLVYGFLLYAFYSFPPKQMNDSL
ncbi:MAG: polysaccharide biosynthesis C-terminal domain-containing protein [Lachnospiraceae bacterium]